MATTIAIATTTSNSCFALPSRPRGRLFFVPPRPWLTPGADFTRVGNALGLAWAWLGLGLGLAWAGLGLGWAGLGWAGLGWAGLGWAGLGLAGLG